MLRQLSSSDPVGDPVLDNSGQSLYKALNVQEELSMHLVSISLKNFYISLLLSAGQSVLIMKQKNI